MPPGGEANPDDFKEEMDPITLLPAAEIPFPVAFKDGKGGLKPPIYDIRSLSDWIVNHKPTFPHTGLYSDLSQVAALTWRGGVPAVDTVETARLLQATQLQTTQLRLQPTAIIVVPSNRAPHVFFRYFMATQFLEGREFPSWVNDYWFHHPYNAYDHALRVPISVNHNRRQSWNRFRLEMARRMAEEDVSGAIVQGYWGGAHPIDFIRDDAETIREFFRHRPI
jgi:hypothetical protein